MSKKLFFFVLLCFSLSMFNAYSQYSLDFEDPTKYTAAQQSNGVPHSEFEAITNPEQSGLNTSATCMRITETTGAAQWEFPFISNGSSTFGFVKDATNGNFVKFHIMSANETDFEFKIEPWIANAKDTSLPALSFSGVTLNTWIEVAFDLSALPDGWVSRIEIRFNPTGGTRDGDVFYLDNLQQDTTLSNTEIDEVSNSFIVYPNPTDGIINISKLRNSKTISVHNVLGQEVKRFGNISSSIDISDLNKGLYLLKTDTGYSHKIIKQ